MHARSERNKERGGRTGAKCFASRNTIVGSQQITGNTQRSETSGETDTHVAYAVCATKPHKNSPRSIGVRDEDTTIKR